MSQLQRWYRTLDHLILNKDQVEVALYERLRTLFDFEADLVLYDITSTYFEGAGPAGLAKHGYSRDGKPRNVQVVVGVVMVAGSFRNVPSLSSASTTIQSPAPRRALVP